MANLLCRDLLSGESYIVTVECLRIMGFAGSRVDAMRDLRKLLPVDIKAAQHILNNLPYLVCETSDEEEYLRWHRAAQKLGFTIEHSEYSRTELA